MISYIKDEPLIKRLFIGVIVTMTLIYGLFVAFQFNQLNKIHKKQIETFQRVTGVMVMEYPDKEVEIVEAIFKGRDKDVQKFGEDVLRKYGYDLEVEMLNDNTFVGYRKGLMKINIWMIGLILFLNIVLLFMAFRKMISYFKKVSHTLDNFIKGNYESEAFELNTGVVSRVSNQLKKVGSSVDLKQQRLMAEKKSAQELVTDISHQLKTPLASLDMCNSILMEDDLDKVERVEFLESSGKNIKKLESLIDVLVNISRLEADMMKITQTDSSIKETLTKAISSVYMKALNKNIEIELEEFVDRVVPHDSKWTEEAIFNVLENGIKYTPEGGLIKISVSENINYMRITVKDNGIGIKKEEYNNIFKRFHRGNDVKVKNIEGSGVGLYLTRKILEEQGGSVMVKSNFGEGSEFTILLRKIME